MGPSGRLFIKAKRRARVQLKRGRGVGRDISVCVLPSGSDDKSAAIIDLYFSGGHAQPHACFDSQAKILLFDPVSPGSVLLMKTGTKKAQARQPGEGVRYEKNKLEGASLLFSRVSWGAFLVYPLLYVFIYSMEEGYNFPCLQTYFGTGTYNYSYVLHYLYSAGGKKHLFVVIITVPVPCGAFDSLWGFPPSGSCNSCSRLFICLCDQYAGGGACVHDPVHKTEYATGW